MNQYGTVTGIDRANNRVGARLDDGYAQWLTDGAQGFPYRGAPPPPLSRCWFSDLGRGQWVCEGPLGDSRVILHDDFTRVGASAAFVQLDDTPWTETTNNATSNYIQSTEALQTGAVVLRQQTTLGNFTSIHKDIGIVMPDPTLSPITLWFSALWHPGNVLDTTLTSLSTEIGLGDLALWSFFGAGYDGVIMRYDAAGSANYQFLTATAGANTATVTPTPAAATFSAVDIVYAPGLWAAGWVDGDGPYVNTTNLPPVGTALAPGTQLRLNAGVTRYSTVDFIHVETVAEVADPQLLLDGR